MQESAPLTPNLFKGKLYINTTSDLNKAGSSVVSSSCLATFWGTWHPGQEAPNVHNVPVNPGAHSSGSKDIYWINPSCMRGHMGILTYTPQTGFAAVFLGQRT